jgi:hypothetical protein
MDNIAIKLPITGHEVFIRPHSTARYSQAVRGVILKDRNIDISNLKEDDPEAEKKLQEALDLKTLPAEALNELTNLQVKHLVISIGSKKADEVDIVEVALDLPEEDYDFLTAECDKVTKKSKLDSKKK